MAIEEIRETAFRWALDSQRRSLTRGERRQLETWLDQSEQHKAEFDTALALLSRADQASELEDMGMLDRFLLRAKNNERIIRWLWRACILAAALAALLFAFSPRD